MGDIGKAYKYSPPIPTKAKVAYMFDICMLEMNS